MTLQDHGNLFQTGITGTLTNTIDGDLNLTGTVEHTLKCIGSSHTQVIMTVGRDDSTIDIIYIFHQVTNLLAKLIWQAITSGVRDVYDSGTCLDDGLNDTSQVLIVRSSGILSIELHIIHKTARILHRSNSSFDNLLTRTVELEFDMLITRTNTCMDTLVLGILQRFGSHVDITLHGPA